MENADLREVFKRLAGTNKPLLDERFKELPVGEERQPLFSCTRTRLSNVVEST